MYTTKTYGEWSDSYTFLDLGSRWMWVVSFTHLPSYPRGMSPRYPLHRMLGGPQGRSGCLWIIEESCTAWKRTLVVEPGGRRYTDLAIPTQSYKVSRKSDGSKVEKGKTQKALWAHNPTFMFKNGTVYSSGCCDIIIRWVKFVKILFLFRYKYVWVVWRDVMHVNYIFHRVS
jgi:hypothetical protein